MQFQRRVAVAAAIAALLYASTWVAAQTSGQKEEFTAVAMVNNNIASGAGNVQIQVTRWSTPSERNKLVNTLLEKGPDDLLKALRKTRPVGIIKTPDSLGYDLHYSQQTPTPEGGRRIVLATDRPIGFWEAANQPRTIDYPFTIIEMHIDKDGHGTGTLSYATKVTAKGDVIELENFASAPVMLTQIEAKTRTS